MQVLVKCYGVKKIYKSKKEVRDTFSRAFICSEGREKQRYANILEDLNMGLTYCDDKDGV